MEIQYNCRVYEYATGQHVTFFSKTIVRKDKGNEESGDMDMDEEEIFEEKTERSQEQIEHSMRVSMNRTKNNIYNVSRSNVWEWFITLTFDRTKVDSSDYDTVIKKLSKFMNNLQQRKCPNLKYLIVPELHADGEHYHFHGLLAGCEGMDFVDSGRTDKKGNTIYNIANWTFGFTTATQVQDTGKVSSYITKYITKETVSYLPNKRRFYTSKNINKAEPKLLLMDEMQFLEVYGDKIVYCKTITVAPAYQQIKYYELAD